MSDEKSALPARLQEIIEDFGDCLGQEKLEYLLEFAESLPPLPERLQGQQAAMDQVHECITPIFIHAELDNGGMMYYFDVPPEGPTVRGFAEIMRQGVNGLAPDAVLRIPGEFYLQMGLQAVLSGQRLNGISAILAHMKQLALPFNDG
jgi:cysteine desulfuration protein SufE